jgi:hypothetical protein
MLDVGYFLTPQKGNIAIYKFTKYFWVCVCGLLIPFVRTIMLCPSGARDPVTDIYCYRHLSPLGFDLMTHLHTKICSKNILQSSTLPRGANICSNNNNIRFPRPREAKYL